MEDHHRIVEQREVEFAFGARVRNPHWVRGRHLRDRPKVVLCRCRVRTAELADCRPDIEDARDIVHLDFGVVGHLIERDREAAQWQDQIVARHCRQGVDQVGDRVNRFDEVRDFRQSEHPRDIDQSHILTGQIRDHRQRRREDVDDRLQRLDDALHRLERTAKEVRQELTQIEPDISELDRRRRALEGVETGEAPIEMHLGLDRREV